MRTIVSTDLNANPRGFKMGTRELHQAIHSFFSAISKNNRLCCFTFAAEIRLMILALFKLPSFFPSIFSINIIIFFYFFFLNRKDI